MVVGLSGVIRLILLAAAPRGLLPGVLVMGGLYRRLSKRRGGTYGAEEEERATLSILGGRAADV